MKILVLFEQFLSEDQLQLINKINENHSLILSRFDSNEKYSLEDAVKLIKSFEEGESDCIVFLHNKNIEDYEDSSISSWLLNNCDVVESFPTTPDDRILQEISEIEQKLGSNERNDRLEGIFLKIPKLFRTTVHIVWVLTKAAWVASISYSIMILLKYIAQ